MGSAETEGKQGDVKLQAMKWKVDGLWYQILQTLVLEVWSQHTLLS